MCHIWALCVFSFSDISQLGVYDRNVFLKSLKVSSLEQHVFFNDLED